MSFAFCIVFLCSDFAADRGELAEPALWQVASLDIDDPGNCLMRFKSNRYVGWIVLGGILAAGAL